MSNRPLAGPEPERMPVYGLLDGVRSAWNVGSMFRSADGAGLAGLYLCGMTPTPPRPDLEKTALGATVTVPWDYWREGAAAARRCRELGLPLVALELTPAAAPYDRFPYPFPMCFAVGHEVEGISAEVLAQADAVVGIPMAGRKGSLNVAVSFGILAYEIRRRWLSGRETRGSA